MFALDVYGTDGRVLNIEQLFEQLKRVASQSGEPAPGLGVMTTEDRDQWGKIYTELLQGNGFHSSSFLPQDLGCLVSLTQSCVYVG